MGASQRFDPPHAVVGLPGRPDHGTRAVTHGPPSPRSLVERGTGVTRGSSARLLAGQLDVGEAELVERLPEGRLLVAEPPTEALDEGGEGVDGEAALLEVGRPPVQVDG